MPFGSAHVCEVSDQFSGKLVYFGALEVVKFSTSKIVNRRTEDGRYVDALAIEDISVQRESSPIFPSPSSRLDDL
jgi:hypothetical protein